MTASAAIADGSGTLRMDNDGATPGCDATWNGEGVVARVRYFVQIHTGP